MISLSRSLSPFPRTLVVAFLLLLCWEIPDGDAQQAKPNLSGSWRLIPAKTVHPQWWHEMKDYSCVIKVDGPKISMTHIHQGGPIETEVYFTDDKEHLASPLNKEQQMRAKTHWDGNVLVIEKKRQAGASRARVWTNRYELSEDGKLLRVSGHYLKSPFSDKPFDVIWTFEKQPR